MSTHEYPKEMIDPGADAPVAPAAAVVYPPDGTVSPFTVINLGAGAVRMGDAIHDGRLPALWFGRDGEGMGHEVQMDREAREGETLATVTFANVEGLDVLLDVLHRCRRRFFPTAAPVAPAEPAEGWVLVPKRMTQEMRDVTDSEGWTWEDLLAEAGSISQEEYAAIAAAPVAPAGDKPATSETVATIDLDKDAITDVIAAGLRGTYHCHRVWSAWGVGTMSEDDFSPVDESDTPAELADAVLALFATSPPDVPPGWVLVPVEPTDAMKFAGAKAYFGGCHDQNDFNKAYRAMLAAAPKAPT